jgi:acetyl esterase/lipase
MMLEEVQLQEGISNATLTAYIQEPISDSQLLQRKPAIIICPGGAFLGFTEKETEPVALRFLSEGFQAFVLRYSIGTDFARFPSPFIDAAKAVMSVRQNCDRWGTDPNRIILCGFSTGGQVAATLGATWREDYLKNSLKADSQLFKPNALILGYPLLDMECFYSFNQHKSQEMDTLLEMMFTSIYGTMFPTKQMMEKWNIVDRINVHFPPTFLWTTSEDSFIDVEESMKFIKTLAAYKIPYEFHIFERGAHGMSLGTEGLTGESIKNRGNAPKWFELAMHWMKDLY